MDEALQKIHKKTKRQIMKGMMKIMELCACNKFFESKKLTLNGQHQVEVNLSYHSEKIAPCKPFTLLKQTIRKFYQLILSPLRREPFFYEILKQTNKRIKIELSLNLRINLLKT